MAVAGWVALLLLPQLTTTTGSRRLLLLLPLLPNIKKLSQLLLTVYNDSPANFRSDSFSWQNLAFPLSNNRQNTYHGISTAAAAHIRCCDVIIIETPPRVLSQLCKQQVSTVFPPFLIDNGRKQRYALEYSFGVLVVSSKNRMGM